MQKFFNKIKYTQMLQMALILSYANEIYFVLCESVGKDNKIENNYHFVSILMTF